LLVQGMKSENLQVNRNIHFTKLVKVHERLREFNFRLLPGYSNNLFHVDVPDDRGNRIMFRMQRVENNYWQIQDDGLPSWVSANEKLLNEAIAGELG
jgi:hypothetical protein